MLKTFQWRNFGECRKVSTSSCNIFCHLHGVCIDIYENLKLYPLTTLIKMTLWTHIDKDVAQVLWNQIIILQLKGKFFWCLERVKLLITNFIQWVLTNFCLFDDFVHLVSIFFLSPRNFPVSIFSQSQAVLVKLVVKEFLINQLSIEKILSDLSKFSLVMWEQLLYRLNKLLMYFFHPKESWTCA